MFSGSVLQLPGQKQLERAFASCLACKLLVSLLAIFGNMVFQSQSFLERREIINISHLLHLTIWHHVSAVLYPMRDTMPCLARQILPGLC